MIIYAATENCYSFICERVCCTRILLSKNNKKKERIQFVYEHGAINKAEKCCIIINS